MNHQMKQQRKFEQKIRDRESEKARFIKQSERESIGTYDMIEYRMKQRRFDWIEADLAGIAIGSGRV